MKKSVAFKATSSSKDKAKPDTSSEDEDSSFDDTDDEKMVSLSRDLASS
jgi:hypothetical protein